MYKYVIRSTSSTSSGRRRVGDFHFHMQKLIEEDFSVISGAVMVLSIDTAMKEEMNVHSDRLCQFLLQIARRGQILAFL